MALKEAYAGYTKPMRFLPKQTGVRARWPARRVSRRTVGRPPRRRARDGRDEGAQVVEDDHEGDHGGAGDGDVEARHARLLLQLSHERCGSGGVRAGGGAGSVRHAVVSDVCRRARSVAAGAYRSCRARPGGDGGTAGGPPWWRGWRRRRPSTGAGRRNAKAKKRRRGTARENSCCLDVGQSGMRVRDGG